MPNAFLYFFRRAVSFYDGPIVFFGKLKMNFANAIGTPTLRQRAYQVAGMLEKEFGPYGLALYLDDNPDAFDVKRGQQDIVEKRNLKHLL